MNTIEISRNNVALLSKYADQLQCNDHPLIRADAATLSVIVQVLTSQQHAIEHLEKRINELSAK